MKRSLKNKNFKEKGLFIFLVFIAIVFIAASVFIVTKTNSIRSEIEKGVTSINTTSIINRKSTKLIDSIRSKQEINFKKSLSDLQNEKSNLNIDLEFEPLQISLDRLNPDFKIDKEAESNITINELTTVSDLSHQLTVKKRKHLGLKSEQLGNYWTATYMVIGTACLLTVLLSLLGLSIVKDKQQIRLLTNRNIEFLDNSTDAIVTCGADRKIKRFNAAAEVMFGYKENEIIKKHIKTLYQSEEDFNRALESMLSNGSFNGEVMNRDNKGNTIISSVSANLTYDHKGKVNGSMGIFRDVTAIKKLEKEYQQIVKSASDVIYATSAEGIFTYINPTVEKVLGYKTEELIGKSFATIIHKDYVNFVSEHYQKAFQNRLVESHLELKVIKKDGTSIWIGQNVQTNFDPSDKTRISGYYGIVRDIEKRKQAEIVLKESEERYRELFDNSNDLIHSIDSEGNFIYVNRTWKEVMGYSEDEIKSLKLYDIIHPESLAHCQDIFKRIIEYKHDPKTKVSFKVLTKNKDTILLEGSLSFSDIKGKVISVQSFLRDITEKEKAESLLKKSEATFRKITETINDVFYLYNIPEQKYEYISPNIEGVLGANQEFFYNGRSHTAEFGHPEDTEILKKAQEIVESGNPYNIEYRLIIDGEIRWINEKSFPIKDDQGNIVSNSGICRDITEVKTAQETIHKQNLEIESGILYAKRIQDSVLPDKYEMTKILPDSFILYYPKDVLSGDFYIVDQITDKKGAELSAFIVADCTGHGVPGGILSLLCNRLIKETFTNKNINSPNEALNSIREKLNTFFRTSETDQIQDGMDVSFCVLNKKENILYFSGANSSCLIVRKNELIEYKGNRQHIGFSLNQKEFTNHSIDVQSGDCIYLYSDGIVDQFGGPNNKKFMRKRLHPLLSSYNGISMDEQSELIKQAFLSWKGDQDQTDDITVLGMRIS